ncbi:MAG TPA: hypothetical protein VHY91_20255, partial [Pirellulales bacterium]|nr:hypothetical protein [Pirellulales bacterium]
MNKLSPGTAATGAPIARWICDARLKSRYNAVVSSRLKIAHPAGRSVLDKFTRECLTIDVARKLPSGAKRDSWSYQRDFAHPSF